MDNSSCTIYSNGIPNHNFGINGSFAKDFCCLGIIHNKHESRNCRYTITTILQYDNAVFLNGVKLDLIAAACYGVGPDPLGQEKIGCFDSETPWRCKSMHPSNDFGEDDNHAHTQPDGAYHYHGEQMPCTTQSGLNASGVIGYAADGFPIRGPFIEDNGTFRLIQSGYVLKADNRTSKDGEGEFPGGQWDGTFRDDFEWQQGAGDLDQCNGMLVDGVYSYFVTYSTMGFGLFAGTLMNHLGKGRDNRYLNFSICCLDYVITR